MLLEAVLQLGKAGVLSLLNGGGRNFGPQLNGPARCSSVSGGGRSVCVQLSLLLHELELPALEDGEALVSFSRRARPGGTGARVVGLELPWRSLFYSRSLTLVGLPVPAAAGRCAHRPASGSSLRSSAWRLSFCFRSPDACIHAALLGHDGVPFTGGGVQLIVTSGGGPGSGWSLTSGRPRNQVDGLVGRRYRSVM